jgi:hypothetical protein
MALFESSCLIKEKGAQFEVHVRPREGKGL